MSQSSDRERALEDLCEDAIATVLGWAMLFCDLAGADRNDPDAVPMTMAKELIDRMHGLGFGFYEGNEKA